MSGQPWSEHLIARALALQTFNRKYLLVVPNCNWTGHECDVLCVTENLRVIDVEIKISRADLKADAKKEKWWQRYLRHPDSGRYEKLDPAIHREWPMKVWKHYYAVPADIWSDDLLPCLGSSASGVLLLHRGAQGDIKVSCHRSPKPNRDAEPISARAAVDIARLASLRMWQAYAALPQAREAVEA